MKTCEGTECSTPSPHEKIAFEGVDCPLGKALRIIDDLTDDLLMAKHLVSEKEKKLAAIGREA